MSHLRQIEVNMKAIENFFLFKGLEEKEKKNIIKGFNAPLSFKKGDIIYSATQFPDAIGYVVSGEAVAVTNNGHNVHMRTFEKGACFGVAAIFSGNENYVSTITAKSDSQILFISETELRNIFLENPKTAINYIEFLSGKIRFLNTKLSVISCGCAEDTVLKYLISVADSDNNAKIPKSMTLLAKTLGLGRATLYRSLDNLERDGIILRENNNIKVIKNEKNS